MIVLEGVSKSASTDLRGVDESTHPTDNKPFRYLALKCEENDCGVVWRA